MRTLASLFAIASSVHVFGVPAHAQDVITLTDVIDGGSGGLAVDGDGDIYMGDFGPTLSGGGTRVFRVTPAGDVSVFATGFNGASGNDFASNGDLFQSNINAGRIDRVTPDGTRTPFVSAGIVGPVGIAIDEDDNLFVCNCGNDTIRKVTPFAVSTEFAASALLQCPNGITFASDGNLYVANFENGNLLRITPEGIVTLHATVPGGNNGHLTFHGGFLYVAGRGANRIYRVSLDGIVTVFAGSGIQGVLDGPRLQARFSLPNDVIVDPTGTYMYVNDVVDPVNASDTSPMVLRRIDVSDLVGVDDPSGPPVALPGPIVHAPRPNPFRSLTALAYETIAPGATVLTIYDVQGRPIRRFTRNHAAAGSHEVRWDGRDGKGRSVGAGVYFVQLSTSAGTATSKVERR